MRLSLLPRVKVNFTLLDLIKSIFVSESDDIWRSKCKTFFSKFYGVENVLLVPSARDAIYELLIRLSQPKVVIPAYTCNVVNEAVEFSGKQVVYSGNKSQSFNASYIECIDKDCIVLATHQYGLPCDIEKIADKCRIVGAVLIEDCATSLGTTVNGKLTGTFGDYALVSFNMSKTLNVPPFGGVLLSKNNQLIDNIEKTSGWLTPDWKFKLKGLIKGTVFVIAKNPILYRISFSLVMKKKHSKHTMNTSFTDFYKYSFSEWQASILYKQLKRLNENMDGRKRVYEFYDKNIDNPILRKPVLYSDAVCTRYAIWVENKKQFALQCLKMGIDLDNSHTDLNCPPNL